MKKMMGMLSWNITIVLNEKGGYINWKDELILIKMFLWFIKVFNYFNVIVHNM